MRFILLALLGSFGLIIGDVHAQPAPAENTGPNTSIVRTVTGKMTFRTLSDGRVRGGEDFRLLVHPDGSRQMFISKDFKAVNAQQSMMTRVDARFRPLETYASYWTRDGFKGSIYVTRQTLFTHTSSRESTQKMADELFEVVGSGKVKIRIDQRYPLEQIQQAHRDLEARKTTGSTVITL